MNWAEARIQQYLWEFSDGLVEDSEELVDDTGIYKSGGLSVSQIHNLLQTARQAKSIDRIRYFIDEAVKRSFPKEPGRVTNAEGKGWKFGWSKDSSGERGTFFSDELKKRLKELEHYAEAGAAGIGDDYSKEMGIAMARRFLTYMSWYVSWKRMKLRESEGG